MINCCTQENVLEKYKLWLHGNMEEWCAVVKNPQNYGENLWTKDPVDDANVQSLDDAFILAGVMQ